MERIVNMPKPNDETFKNRHVPHGIKEESIYVFPNTNKNLEQFCTIEEILKEFVPLKKKRTKKKKSE